MICYLGKLEASRITSAECCITKPEMVVLVCKQTTANPSVNSTQTVSSVQYRYCVHTVLSNTRLGLYSPALDFAYM